MAEETDKPLDIYADAYQVSSSPYAATINFSLSSPLPLAPGAPPKVDHLVSIRLSLENLKLLAFFMCRQVQQHEQNYGVDIQLPRQVLNAAQIGPEDWQAFWKRDDRSMGR